MVTAVDAECHGMGAIVFHDGPLVDADDAYSLSVSLDEGGSASPRADAVEVFEFGA